jgi:hypothetical protein
MARLYCFVNRKTGRRGIGMPLDKLIAMTARDDPKNYGRIFEAWQNSTGLVPDVDEEGYINQEQDRTFQKLFREDFVNAWNFHDEDYEIVLTEEI